MTTPAGYEVLVAEHFQVLGYETTLTAATGDYGLDVLASNEQERIAIQAKRYGGSSRKVNRQMVMELHGVAAYFDCQRAVLATDGELLPSALEVAKKLGIEVLHLPLHSSNDDQQIPFTAQATSVNTPPETGAPDALPSFNEIWQRYIWPLAGQTLTRSNGGTNEVVAVDWGGITRISSNGKHSRIDIEIFRLAVNQLLSEGTITRQEINDNYAKRASSGVVLVLAQVPIFAFETSPQHRLVLKPREF